VAEQAAVSFGGLLRQLRAEARLTQEELAGAAGLSPRSVSDLERGINHTAHKDTAKLLADALNLTEPVRGLFVAAARGRAPAADVLAARHGQQPGASAAAATRALPRNIAAFTGRQAELAQLMGALAETATRGEVVGIHAIGGMAGVGKTTFAVHAAHRLAAAFPDGQFFLPLHAHTAGQRPVDPTDALASLLLTAGVPPAQIPPGLEARAARWRDYVAGKKILLVLDDASGHEQVRPLLPGTAGSLVLLTSRRRLSALEDATVISLDTLTPYDAAVLLVRLAARPGLRAGDVVAGGISRLCGYLPLAIGMLASQLRHHPTWNAASLAADLAAARDRLALMRAENLSVAAAFDLSYRDLGPDQQQLFRRLGLVPGPTVDAYTAAALVTTDLGTARRLLDELYDHHLLTEPAPGRYLLHDLLREHARALVTADDPAERDAAVGRLLDYYLHTTLTAGRHILIMTAAQGQPPPGDPRPVSPTCRRLIMQRPGWKPNAPTCRPPRTLRPCPGGICMPYRSLRQSATSCVPAVTGSSLPRCTGPPWKRPAAPVTDPAKPSPCASWAFWPGTPETCVPPPSTSPGRQRCMARSGTSPARPTPSTSWASCGNGKATTPPHSPAASRR
jgi:transcriptional regulator with XRE-family HTH domain